MDVFLGAQTKQGVIWLVMDTGNLGPVMLAPHAVAQLGLADSWPAAETAGPQPVTLDLIGLGAVTALARRREIIYDGVLNFDTLSNLIITIDLPTGRAWARRAQ